MHPVTGINAVKSRLDKLRNIRVGFFMDWVAKPWAPLGDRILASCDATLVKQGKESVRNYNGRIWPQSAIKHSDIIFVPAVVFYAEISGGG